MILAPLILGLALAPSPYRPLVAETAPVRPAVVCTKEKAVETAGIANLPFAMGRRFATLDEYLAHLRCRAAPIDKPWWKEIRPGVYEHVTTATNAKRDVATRAELMKRFGFSE